MPWAWPRFYLGILIYLLELPKLISEPHPLRVDINTNLINYAARWQALGGRRGEDEGEEGSRSGQDQSSLLKLAYERVSKHETTTWLGV